MLNSNMIQNHFILFPVKNAFPMMSVIDFSKVIWNFTFCHTNFQFDDRFLSNLIDFMLELFEIYTFRKYAGFWQEKNLKPKKVYFTVNQLLIFTFFQQNVLFLRDVVSASRMKLAGIICLIFFLFFIFIFFRMGNNFFIFLFLWDNILSIFHHYLLIQ